MNKVMIILGTRPEAIKLASVIKKLRNQNEIKLYVVSTGQHKELLDSVIEELEIEIDYRFDSMVAGQTLITSMSKIVLEIEKIVDLVKPYIIITVGDTTTTYASSIVAFFLNINLVHIEAGLRTNEIRSPFPEEFYRQSVSLVSSVNFTPTLKSEMNLIKEGVPINKIFTVGNTVIDLLKESLELQNMSEFNEKNNIKIVVITLHRRENHGTYHENILNAIERLALRFSNVSFVIPLHMNPLVKNKVIMKLSSIYNVSLVQPMSVREFHRLLSVCYFVITDSGGIQEETTYLGKPTLVVREHTERVEGLESGPLILAGVMEETVFDLGCRLIEDDAFYKSKSIASNVYGDGNAAELIYKTLYDIIFQL